MLQRKKLRYLKTILCLTLAIAVALPPASLFAQTSESDHLRVAQIQDNASNPIRTGLEESLRAGQEENLAINRLGKSDAAKLADRMKTIPAFGALVPATRLEAAQAILRSGPFQDANDFRQKVLQLDKTFLREHSLGGDIVKQLAGKLDYSRPSLFSRRWFVGFLGAAALTAAIGVPWWLTRAPQEGIVIWDFIFHGEAELEEMPNRLDALAKANPGRKIILAGEKAPPRMERLRITYPDTAALIKNIGDVNDSILESDSKIKQSLQRTMEEYKANVPEQIEKTRQFLSRGYSLRELKNLRADTVYMAQHPEIQEAYEVPSLEGQLPQLRSDFELHAAIKALYFSRDRKEFLRAMAAHYREQMISVEKRDAEFSQHLEQLMKDNPGAIIVVWRGAGHRPAASLPSYQKYKFQTKVNVPEEDIPGPLYALVDDPANSDLRRKIMSGEGFPESDQAIFEKLLEHMPWETLVTIFEAGGKLDYAQSHSRASQIMDAVRAKGQVGNLTRAFQDNRALIFGDGKSDVLQPQITTGIVSILTLWLSDYGYLKDHKQYLSGPLQNFLRENSGPIRGGLEEDTVDEDKSEPPSDASAPISLHIKVLGTAIRNAMSSRESLGGLPSVGWTGFLRDELPVLAREFKTEIEPIQDDLPAFLRFLKSRDAVPSDLMAEARLEIANKVGLPSGQIFFIRPNDYLAWGLFYDLNNFKGPSGELRPHLNAGGFHVSVPDASGQLVRLLFIASDLNDFAGLSALAHEAAHSRQSISAVDLTQRNELVRSIIEGLQQEQEHQILLSLAESGTAFGQRIAQVIQDHFRETAPPSEQRSAKALSMQLGLLLWGTYKQEHVFVGRMRNRVGDEALQKVYQEGDLTDLISTLGPSRYQLTDSILDQFRQLQGRNQRFYQNVGLSVASHFGLVSREYTPRETELLLGFFQILVDLLSKNRVFQEEQDESFLFSEEVIDLAEEYMQAGISGTESTVDVTRILDNFQPYSPESGLEETVTVTQTGPVITTATALRDELAGLPRVTISSTVTDPQRVLIVTPDGLPKLTLAAVFAGPNGQSPLIIEALATDDAQKGRVESALRELGLNKVSVHSVKTEFGGNTGEGVTALEMAHWQQNQQTLVVTALSGLEEIARFLGVPGVESELRGVEAVAENSQLVWS